PLLLLLKVIKLGIAHNLDVRVLSLPNVMKGRETKTSNRHQILYQTPTKTSSSTGISPAHIRHQRAKPHYQIQSLKLEFLNSTAMKTKLIPGHYPS
ncbi:hypothetical protein A2U01_0070558, partial [Trifolium medium]|nr:hypothetical protein [Trifolium medium]